MVEWSIDAFRACDSVRSLVVAAPPGHRHELSGADLGVVAGGATRSQSVVNALEAVGTGLVAIHDAARPLVTAELIEALVALLDTHPEAAGAIPAAPITDTVKEAPAGGRSRGAFGSSGDQNAPLVVERTLDRSRLWGAQTPQVFRTGALRAALEVDEAQRDAATDESMLVEQVGGTVLIHPSGPENLKVTTPHDLQIAAMLLAERAASGGA